jgi:hypothetical protein
LRGKDQVFSYKYPDGGEDLVKALFPAVYLSRKWEGSLREVQVNFSRKIEPSTVLADHAIHHVQRQPERAYRQSPRWHPN